MSGDIRPATGTRIDVTYFDRSPYAISSLRPFSVGSDAGVWAITDGTPPRDRPARAAPCCRNPLRLFRFEPMESPSADLGGQAPMVAPAVRAVNRKLRSSPRRSSAYAEVVPTPK